MSYSVSGTTISLTRGDTFKAILTITNRENEPYIPVEGDKIRFAMHSSYGTTEPLLVKDIPIDTMILIIDPTETKDLAFGKYVYDVELTNSIGEVDTFITKATIRITEEVF